MKRVLILIALWFGAAQAQVTTSPSVTGVGQPSNALNTINLNSAPLPAAPAGTALQIGGATGTNSLDMRYGFAGSSQIVGVRADTSAAAPSAIQNGDNILVIGARGYGATAYQANNGTAISMAAAQAWTDAAQGTQIFFGVTPNGTTNQATAVTIGNDKSLSVVGNITSTTGTLSAVIASNGAAQTGYLCYNTAGGVITYDSASTCLVSLEEYKDAIAPITGRVALGDVMRLRPFWGSYKQGTPMSDHRVQPFFGAHQVESVDPRLAAYTETGDLHGVRYQNITAVLAAAIQEQQSQINSLMREVKRLKRKVH